VSIVESGLGLLLLAMSAVLFVYAYRAKRRILVPAWIRTDMGETATTLLVLGLAVIGAAFTFRGLVPSLPSG
jgi:hypothetical protein